VRDFPTESAAWAEVEKQHLQTQINKSDFRGRVTFADLAQHYMRHEPRRADGSGCSEVPHNHCGLQAHSEEPLS